MSSRTRLLRALVRLTIRTGSELTGPAMEQLGMTEKEMRRAVQVIVKKDIKRGKHGNTGL